MKVVFTKQFSKSFKKLDLVNKKRVNHALEAFDKNPFDVRLKKHGLIGDKRGFRSISAGFDLRIIFQEVDGYLLVVLVDVGTHAKVY